MDRKINKMKQVVYYGPEDVRIEEKDIPTAGEGEVIVRNRVALTCGTDVKTFVRGYPLWDPPYTFGHEAAGEVVEVGKGVTDFEVGDRVVAHNSAPCNECYYCKKGQHSMCENIQFNLGAFSQYQKIPKAIVKQNMFKIPDDMHFVDAALLEPFSCAVYGIEEIGIELSDIVVVNGAGPIGLMFTKLATLKGAKVITTDLSDERLELAKKLGAEVTLNVKDKQNTIELVKSYTEDGRGADVVVEAVGIKETWENSVLMSREGGKVLLFGGTKKGINFEISTELLHYSQLTIKGVFHTTPKHVKMAFELLKRGVISAEDFVSNQYKIDDIKEALIEHKEGKVIKNLVLL